MVGRTISHYRIESELGRGGMGVVYRARDLRLRRDVALKLLREEMAGQADRRARVLAEARAAAALNHPTITTIYEVGEEGDLLFIVMELLSGGTLRAAIEQGPMPPRALARLGAQVAEGLAAAHAEGVVHGDIKPENIMLQPDGRVKLLDFGIARQLAEQTVTLTRAALDAHSSAPQMAGTLAYIAPEQLLGGEAGPGADLYSLGVVLYELACGHRPFPGPTATALMSQVLHDDPPSLGAAAPEAPLELVRIVHQLLAKQSASRCASARGLHADLNNLARDLELGAAGIPAAVAGKRAIAVLPFQLLTPNPEDEYLSVALADAVINRLSAGGELLVRPTSTVRRYLQQSVDSLAAARELNVQVVVEGSIQKVGPRLRVHVQALEAPGGAALLSGKYDSEMADLFGLQDTVAAELAAALLPSQPAAAPPAERPTRNAAAYQAYLRGRERLIRSNRWDIRTAIEMLESATALDPRFADAWASLAEAYLLLAVSFDPSPRWFRLAERAVRRASSLDRHNAEAQVARGQILWSPAKRFQNRAALRALAAALRRRPGATLAVIWQSLILYHVGLHDESIEGINSALAVNPDEAVAHAILGQALTFQGRYEEADECFDRAVALNPAAIWPNVLAPMASLFGNRLDRAAEMIRAGLKVMPGDCSLISCEALLWVKRGERRRGVLLMQKALRGGKTLLHTHHLWHNAAAAYALLGKPAPAVALLRKCAATGLPNYPAFRDDPHFAALHNHPPFLRLMAALKKEWTSYQREFGG